MTWHDMKWHEMTWNDMRHVTCDMWQVTYDTWCGVNILSKFQLSSFNGFGVMMFWKLGGKGSLTELMTKVFVEQPRLQRVCLLLIGRGRPVADLFCKVIPWPWPFGKRLAVHHWLYYSRWMRGEATPALLTVPPWKHRGSPNNLY